jgi:hypothetical protein
MFKLEKGGGVLVGEYAYTKRQPRISVYHTRLLLAWQPIARDYTCFGRGCNSCPTLGGGYKKGTLRRPGASSRGAVGQHAVSLESLLGMSAASGF